MWSIIFKGFSFGKMWKNMEKRPFFRAAMAGLGSKGIYKLHIMENIINISFCSHR